MTEKHEAIPKPDWSSERIVPIAYAEVSSFVVERVNGAMVVIANCEDIDDARRIAKALNGLNRPDRSDKCIGSRGFDDELLKFLDRPPG